MKEPGTPLSLIAAPASASDAVVVAIRRFEITTHTDSVKWDRLLMANDAPQPARPPGVDEPGRLIPEPDPTHTPVIPDPEPASPEPLTPDPKPGVPLVDPD